MRDRELPTLKQKRLAVAVSARPRAVQPRLSIGRADDPAEVEADRLAAEVMRLLSEGVAEPARDGLDGDADQPGRVRRAAGSPLDRLGGTLASAEVESRIQGRRGRGQPLDESTARSLGDAFGSDFSRVRLHTDAEADLLSRELEARAFTSGTDIFFRADERGSARRPSPILAHELTHVVQQGGAGPVRREVVQRAHPPSDTTAAGASHLAADTAQDNARKQLKAWVEEGAKSLNPRQRNSCEAVLKGRVKLFAVTQTGDSVERTTHEGEDPTQMGAWFPDAFSTGTGDILSAAVSYNHLDLDDDTNVEFEDFTTPGAALRNNIAVYDPLSRTAAYIYETLRHEVQHILDRSAEKGATATVGDPKEQLESYKTEYRAYNYEGSPDTNRLSGVKKVSQWGHTWTERQWAVFKHIYDDYDHTKDGWDNNYTIDGKTFQELVVAYVNPDTEGFNKNNSLAVDEVYIAVQACADNSNNVNDAKVKEVLTKITKLGRDDATFMTKENQDWKKLFVKKFGVEARRRVLDAIQKKAG